MAAASFYVGAERDAARTPRGASTSTQTSNPCNCNVWYGAAPRQGSGVEAGAHNGTAGIVHRASRRHQAPPRLRRPVVTGMSRTTNSLSVLQPASVSCLSLPPHLVAKAALRSANNVLSVCPQGRVGSPVAGRASGSRAVSDRASPSSTID